MTSPPPSRDGAATSPTNVDQHDYATSLDFDAPPARVFEALTTLGGLAGWWTPIVGGDPTAGGELEFGFAGLDEKIVMRVEAATPESSVIWRCLVHSGHPEWQETQIAFELRERRAGRGVLTFRHTGLTPDRDCYTACSSGWDHFLASLLRYAESGKGNPF
jgi:uncharacterized protein YndB with AHSA1/START domain